MLIATSNTPAHFDDGLIRTFLSCAVVKAPEQGFILACVKYEKNRPFPCPDIFQRSHRFCSASQKFYYDRHHQPVFLSVGDWALLRLHKGYKIPSTLGITKKLTQQYVGPSQVLERVGRLAYKLDIPDSWLVQTVLTIAQLEPCLDLSKDPFNSPRDEYIPSISTSDLTKRSVVQTRNEKFGNWT